MTAMSTPRTVPGPKDLGLPGRIVTGIRFLYDSVGVVRDRFERYGDLYRVPGQPDLYVLRHPDHIYQVLVEQAAAFEKKHTALERLREVLGDGLLTSDGDVWRRHRRMIQPAFSHARLVGYAEVMRDESERLADRWSDGASVEMGQEMMELTLAIVCRTLFSHDAGGEAGEVSRAMAALQDAATRPDLLPKFVPTPGRRKTAEAISSLDRIVLRLIRERRARREQDGGADRDDLLERLLAAEDEDGQRFGETEIRDELTTLFLAGHETTAQALTWTWCLLAQHPDVERKLHAELDTMCPDHAPSYADLERLPYTECVVDEAMRLYPPVYLLARRAARDVTLGEHLLPAGSEVVMWVYWTQRDARWFPEPTKFQPDRFTPEMRAKLPRCAYLPFGAGPRACIGKTFASIEARILLATLARRFSATLTPGQRIGIKPRVTLVPKHGMNMMLKARSRP